MNQHVPPPAGRKRKKKSRAVNWLLNLLIAALILAGAYMLARPRIVTYFRDKKTDEVLQAMEGLESPVLSVKIGKNDFKVDGEELEQLGNEGDLEISRAEADDLAPAEIEVNMYATLQIPKIDLTMPVADEATLYSLRVAVGHWSPGAKIGEQGNAVIFGHRLHVYGSHFNRLNEVNTGDQLIVTTHDAVYVYEVSKQITINPSILLQSITEPTSQARLILVTCTPLHEPVGVDRLLIYSHLVEVRPISR